MIPIPYQHWLSNLDFILGALAAFGFFAAGALYGDSWATIRRSSFLLARAGGFLLLALGAGLAVVWPVSGAANPFVVLLEVVGLLLVTGSFFAERLPGQPVGSQAQNNRPVGVRDGVAAFVPFPLFALGQFAAALLGLVASVLVWYHSTVKLERARRGLALALLFCALAWGFDGLGATLASQRGALSLLGEPFGTMWVLASILRGLGSFFLLRWVWGYLRFRLFPQLYLTVVGVAIAISVSAAVFVSVVLAQRAQEQTLDTLDTNVRVFAFSLEELKAQLALVASALSGRTPLVRAVAENDPVGLLTALGDPTADFHIGAATVLNAGGEVLRTIGGGSPVGDSFSEDPAVVRAFQGTIVSSVHVAPGPEFPTVSVRAAAPLVGDGRVVGAVLVDLPVDRAFLDRVKELTGLEVFLYGGTTRAATTLRDEYGRPRTGIEGEDERLVASAYGEASGFRGLVTIGAEPFLASARPLLDVDQERVGLLAVGFPQRAFLQSVENALRMTRAGALALLLVSLLPLYALSRSIARYQRT